LLISDRFWQGRAEISPAPGFQILRRELYNFDLLDERGVMTEVRIYTARYCPYCASAKALLRRKGIIFAEIDIGGNWERRDEMSARSTSAAMMSFTRSSTRENLTSCSKTPPPFEPYSV
jgi:glutaredoxin